MKWVDFGRATRTSLLLCIPALSFSLFSFSRALRFLMFVTYVRVEYGRWIAGVLVAPDLLSFAPFLFYLVYYRR